MFYYRLSGTRFLFLFFSCSYQFTSSDRIIGFCSHLISYGKNQSGLQHRLRASSDGGLVRKAVTSFLSSEFWTASPQVNKRNHFSFHFTARATPRSLLSLLQTYYHCIYGHFSPIMFSFYYYWLLNNSCEGRGKSISLCWLCPPLIPTRREKGPYCTILRSVLILSVLLIGEKEIPFPFSAQRKGHMELSDASRHPCVDRKPKKAYLTRRVDGNLLG